MTLLVFHFLCYNIAYLLLNNRASQGEGRLALAFLPGGATGPYRPLLPGRENTWWAATGEQPRPWPHATTRQALRRAVPTHRRPAVCTPVPACLAYTMGHTEILAKGLSGFWMRTWITLSNSKPLWAASVWLSLFRIEFVRGVSLWTEKGIGWSSVSTQWSRSVTLTRWDFGTLKSPL